MVLLNTTTAGNMARMWGMKSPAQQALQKISSNAISARDTATFSPAALLYRDKVAAMDTAMSSGAAAGLLGSAEEGLKEGSAILSRMQELAQTATQTTLSESERAKIQEEITSLSGRLDKLAENSPHHLLDGSFGGTKGAEGVKNMGIDRINSDGDISGTAKINIDRQQNGITMTMRLNGETVSTTLSGKEEKANFTFSGGKTISVSFSSNAADLKTGVMRDVAFSSGKKSASIKNAVSANRTNGEPVLANNISKSTTVSMPRFLDMSTVGLGLHGLDMSNGVAAAKAQKKIEAAASRVSVLREDVGAKKSAVLKADDPETAVQASRKDKKASAPADLALLARKLKEQPLQALLAQTSQMRRNMAMRLLK